MKRLPILVPAMQCDTGCGECCGIVPVTAQEFSRVNGFIRQNKITPLDQGVTCPFYQDGTCKVYAVRPSVCQLFGHIDDPRMTCPRGYNTNIQGGKGMKMLMAAGRPTRFLHEFLPGFSMDNLLAHVKKYQVDLFPGS